MTRNVSADHELSRVPLFAGLAKRHLGVASQLSTELEVPAGCVLARQGAAGAEFFIVLQGLVDVVRHDQLVVTRGPGSSLGEIALLGARPRTATLVARTPLRVRVASQREFARLLAAVPGISERLHATMAERLAA